MVNNVQPLKIELKFFHLTLALSMDLQSDLLSCSVLTSGRYNICMWVISIWNPRQQELITNCKFSKLAVSLFLFYDWSNSFFKSILFIFKERGREGEKHQYVVASHVAFTGDLARNPGMCPDWESDQGSFGSQPALNPLSYNSQG